MLLLLLAHQSLAFSGDVAGGVHVPVEREAATFAVIDPLPQCELGSRTAL